jgi:hypothetical protein
VSCAQQHVMKGTCHVSGPFTVGLSLSFFVQMDSVKFVCLVSDNGSDVPKQSRSQALVKEAKYEMEQRRRNEEGKRGICADDQLAFASLEAATFKEETRNVRDLIYSTTIEEGNALKSWELIYSMIERAEDSDAHTFCRGETCPNKWQKINELTDWKRKLEAKSDVLRMRQQKRTDRNVPKQVSVDTTTASSSISISGSSLRLSSGKKPRKDEGGQVVLLNDSDNEFDDNEHGENNKAMEQSESEEQWYNSPVVVPREPSNLERGLSRCIERFRAMKACRKDQEDFGMEYPLDLH